MIIVMILWIKIIITNNRRNGDVDYDNYNKMKIISSLMMIMIKPVIIMIIVIIKMVIMMITTTMIMIVYLPHKDIWHCYAGIR